MFSNKSHALHLGDIPLIPRARQHPPFLVLLRLSVTEMPRNAFVIDFLDSLNHFRPSSIVFRVEKN